MLIIYFISFISRTTISTGYSAPVEVLHRTTKWGEVRRLACPLRHFPFAAPPNCGGKGGGASHQRGISLARRAVVKVFYKRAPSINIEAPSATLSGKAAVKLKNPRGDSPVKL